MRSPLIFFTFSNLHALAVGTVGGVDGNHVALVDEEGNHDLCSGLEGNFLKCGGRSGVTLDCRLSVCNFEGYICREFAGEAALLVGDEHHLDMLSFFHKVSILDNVVREVDLLVSFFVHEVEPVLITIKELIGAALHIDSLDLCTSGKSILENASVFEVAKFSLYESRALSGFHMLEPNDHTRLAVEIKVEAVLEICSCCHINTY